MDNTDKRLVEERCHLLNLFMKSLVRCPYLLESEELKLFIRPHIDIEKALTLLPKLNGQQLLERVSRYYSFMGEITESKIQKQMNQVFNFVKQSVGLRVQLAGFTEVIAKMEAVNEMQQAAQSNIRSLC